MPLPYDLPGLNELRELTTGDPRILVAIIDGLPDLEHDCFKGADIEQPSQIWSEGEEIFEGGRDHATHISSVILGQPGTSLEGFAPRCRGLSLTAGRTLESMLNPLWLARWLDFAHEKGAHLVHCAFCQPSQTGQVDDLLLKAVANWADTGRLIVCPAGNNHGQHYCTPAILPGVLPVGALDSEGKVKDFSNWGATLQKQGLMLPGEKVLGAKPGGGTSLQKGTSVAAPLMSGLVALFLSLQLKEGRQPNGQQIREILLETADPGPDDRYLGGFVNIGRATERLLHGKIQQPVAVPPATRLELAPKSPHREGLVPSAWLSKLYAIGSLAYSFETQARIDQFREILGGLDSWNQDAMHCLLGERPELGGLLVWTLEVDTTPLYAIETRGPFGSEILEKIVRLWRRQHEGGYQRISLPGQRSDRRQSLWNGETLPIARVSHNRGFYGWSTASLVEAGVHAIEADLPAGLSLPAARKTLTSFLDRIYYELRNYGATGQERALNFAATNTVQAAQCLTQAAADGLDLESIQAEKSSLCRLGSDCWDVKLRFFDPENGSRSRRVYRFTIDVADIMPVTLGKIQSWPERRR